MRFQDILQRFIICYWILLYHPTFGHNGKYSNSIRTQWCFSWEVCQIIMWLPALIIMPNTFDIYSRFRIQSIFSSYFRRHHFRANIMNVPLPASSPRFFCSYFSRSNGRLRHCYRKNISAKWQTVTGSLNNKLSLKAIFQTT